MKLLISKETLISVRDVLLKQRLNRPKSAEYQEGYMDGVLDFFNTIKKQSEVVEKMQKEKV